MSTSLTAVEGPKLAGLEAVYYCDARELGPLPDTEGLALLGDLVLSAGTQWAYLPGRIYTPELDVDAAPGVHGPSYGHELKGVYAGDATAAATQFAKMHGRRFVLLYRDYQGLVRLVGEPGIGLQFSYKLATGGKPSEPKGYAWAFKGNTPAPALFYTGAFDVADQAPQLPAVGGPVSLYDRAGNVMATALPGQKMILTSAFLATVTVEPV
jgi:hypothetical protein